MNTQEKIKEYTKFIWDDQLPKEEEQFLYNLLDGKPTHQFYFNIDSDYSLYLAYNSMEHNFEGYSDEQIEAFQSIMHIYKSQKLLKIPSISRVLHLLNDNGIIPLLIKGVAFMCYYAPNIPRMMDDIDIYINPNQFEKAVKLLCENGFKNIGDAGHHIALESESLDIDVHRYIYKNGGDVNSDIYDHLIVCSFLGSKVYLLSPEDMIVHQLANRGKDITLLSHRDRHFKWILDCYTLLKQCKMDVNDIIDRAKLVNNHFYVRLTLAKLVELFPNLNNDLKLCLNEACYCKYLACVVKMIKSAQKYDDQSAGKMKINGLPYIVYKVFMRLKAAKIEKYATESKKSLLKVFLDYERLLSIDTLSYRVKRCFSKSKAGSEIGKYKN